MKIFVDTNIFIDILLERETFVKESALIYKLCENNIIEGFIAPITINNIYYICRKSKNINLIKEFLSDIATIFKIPNLNNETIKKANSLNIQDYEDALQYAMAMQNSCEYLITRNTKDFKKQTFVDVLTPKEFLSRI